MAQTLFIGGQSLANAPMPSAQRAVMYFGIGCVIKRRAYNECTWEDCAICAITTFLEVLEVAPKRATTRGSIMGDPFDFWSQCQGGSGMPMSHRAVATWTWFCILVMKTWRGREASAEMAGGLRTSKPKACS